MNQHLISTYFNFAVVVTVVLANAGCMATQDPQQRRNALLKNATRGPDAVPALIQALDDPNPVVRRTAVRILARYVDVPAARNALARAGDDDDMLVRRTALRALWSMPGSGAVAWFRKALADTDPGIRLLAVQTLALRSPRTPEMENLLKKATSDPDDRVRAVASRATWPFHREDRSIRRRADSRDHAITVLQSIPLPKDGWRFRLDRQRNGHMHGWFRPDFDDSKWKTIAIEQAWQKAGYDYIGVAWYRRWVRLPPKPAGAQAAEICFEGVDESAWVWVNGKYVGEHDIGPSGWNRPFTLDITQEIRWGERNLIVVRAMNTAHAGGIWRPVRIEVLK